jgi:hypothetical protein
MKHRHDDCTLFIGDFDAAVEVDETIKRICADDGTGRFQGKRSGFTVDSLVAKFGADTIMPEVLSQIIIAC